MAIFESNDAPVLVNMATEFDQVFLVAQATLGGRVNADPLSAGESSGQGLGMSQAIDQAADSVAAALAAAQAVREIARLNGFNPSQIDLLVRTVQETFGKVPTSVGAAELSGTALLLASTPLGIAGGLIGTGVPQVLPVQASNVVVLATGQSAPQTTPPTPVSFVPPPFQFLPQGSSTQPTPGSFGSTQRPELTALTGTGTPGSPSESLSNLPGSGDAAPSAPPELTALTGDDSSAAIVISSSKLETTAVTADSFNAELVLGSGDTIAPPADAFQARLFVPSIDVTAPAAPILRLDTDTGTSASDRITRTSGFSVSNEEAGALLEYSTDGIAWRTTQPAAVEGDNTVLARQTDSAGNVSATSTFTYTYDTTPPQVVIALSDTAIKIGDSATVTFTFSEVVNGFSASDVIVPNGSISRPVSSDGGITWTATYTPNSSVENADNLISVSKAGVIDVAANAGQGSAASPNYAIDTLPPSITDIAITSASGIQNSLLNAADVVSVTVTLSQAALVTGSPQLTIDMGGTTYLATYASGSGTDALVFHYTVVSPNTDINGIGIPANSVSLNGGTINDAAGNATTLNHAAIGNNASYMVDTTAPAAPVLVLTTDSGTSASDRITHTASATASNAETSATVEYSLDGSTWRTTQPAAVEGDNTVLARQTDSAGNVSATSTFTYTYDTTRPQVAIALSDTAIKIGDSATVTFTFSEFVNGFSDSDVIVPNGSISTPVSSDGGITWTATYTPNSSVEDATNTIGVMRAGVTDLAGNGGRGTSISPNYSVDTLAPTITNVAITAASGIQNSLVNANDVVSITVTMSAVSIVTDSPQLSINIDGDTRQATYASGSGTQALIFNYTIVPGMGDTNGISIPANSVSLHGGTINDAAGNAATLTHAPIADDYGYQVDSIINAGGMNVIATDDVINSREQTVTITGKADANDTVTLTFGSITRQVIANGSGNWSYNLTPEDVAAMGEGESSVAIVTIDAAGNVNNDGRRDVLVDTVAPTIIISAISSGTLIKSEYDALGTTPLVIAGTTAGAQDGQIVTILLDGHSYTATVSSNAWSVNVPTADAQALVHGSSYTAKATVSDLAGNRSLYDSEDVAVDIALPDIPTVTKKITSDTTPVIGGRAQKTLDSGVSYVSLANGDSLAVVVGGVTYNLTIGGSSSPSGLTYNTGAGAWQLDLSDATPLVNGTYDVQVSAITASGTKADISSNELKIDNSPVTVTIGTVAGDDKVNYGEKSANVIISGTTSANVEAGRTVTVTLADSSTTTATVGEDHTWSVTVAGRTFGADGSKTLKADVRNDAGTAAPQATKTVLVDSVGPTIVVTNAVPQYAQDYIVNSGVEIPTTNALVLANGAANFGTNAGWTADTDDAYTVANISAAIPNLTFGTTNYSGTDKVFISTNGYITFGTGNSSYSGVSIPTYATSPLIAGLLNDLRVGQPDVHNAAGWTSTGGNSTGSSYVYYHADAANHVATFTWDDIRPYRLSDAGNPTKGNAFQIRLHQIADEGTVGNNGDFVIEVRYETVDWLNSSNATAGWTAGLGSSGAFGQITGSGTAALTNVEDTTNVGQNGVWMWKVVDGAVKEYPIDISQAIGQTILSLSATDTLSPTPLTYSLGAGADSRFEIVSDNQVGIKAGANFDDITQTTDLILPVKVTDGAGNISSKNVTLTLFQPPPVDIAYSATTFTESAANGGAMATTVTMTLTNDTFAADVVSASRITPSGVPAGLTATFTRVDATHVTATLTGSATNHANANDIANLGFTFGDGSFVKTATESRVTNYAKSDLAVDFNDAPSIAYSATTFAEATANSGTIGNTVTLTLTGDTFVSDVVSANRISAGNVPAGLTAAFTYVDSTHITAALTGTATNHTNANDISNLTFTLANGAFTTTTVAANVINAVKNDLVVDFNNPFPVVSYSSSTFSESMANDGTVATSIKISLANDTFVSDVVSAGRLTASNVPAGMTAAFSYDNSTQITATLTGTATAHANAQDIANLTFSFTDASFTTAEAAADVVGKVKSNLAVNFNDPISLSYSGTTFSEASALNGSIGTTLTLTLNGDTFSAGVVSTGKVSASNVPAGLTAAFTRVDDTHVTVTLTGVAAAHAANNDISNLGITFANGAFVTNSTNSSAVPNYSKTDLKVDFRDAPIITYSGTQFDEVAANNGTVSPTLTLTLTNDTYVENVTSFIDVTNVPAGLTAVFTRVDATRITVSLSGNATNHANVNDVSNLGISFRNGAFTNTPLVGDGYVNTNFDTDKTEAIYAMGIQGGQLYAAGYGQSAALAVARYLPNGAVDKSFDSDGKQSFGLGFGGYNMVADMVFQSSGKIILGSSAVPGYNDGFFALMRLNSDGTKDTTFQTGSYNVSITHFFTNPSAQIKSNLYSLTQQSDGKLVAGGSTFTSVDPVTLSQTNKQFAIARYTSEGNLDTTFDTDGKVTTDFNILGDDFAVATKVATDGKIVAIGQTLNGNSKDIAIARYTTTGALDSTFSGDGKVTFDLGGQETIQGGLLDGSNKIIVIGESASNLFVARVNTDGTLDTSFDGNGWASLRPIAGYTNYARSVALQADGKILLLANAGPYKVVLVRMNADGSLDTSFGGGDGIVLAGNASVGNGYELAVQADGKIVVGGAEFKVVRFNADGSIDTSFDETIGVTNSTVNNIVVDFDNQPSISYSGSTFTESTASSATIGTTITLTLSGDTYTANAANYITASNVPDGLTATFTQTNSSTISAKLTGTATSHSDSDDISNLTFTFGDGAFTNTTVASSVTNHSKNNLAVDFLDNSVSVIVADHFNSSIGTSSPWIDQNKDGQLSSDDYVASWSGYELANFSGNADLATKKVTIRFFDTPDNIVQMHLGGFSSDDKILIDLYRLHTNDARFTQIDRLFASAPTDGGVVTNFGGSATAFVSGSAAIAVKRADAYTSVTPSGNQTWDVGVVFAMDNNNLIVTQVNSQNADETATLASFDTPPVNLAAIVDLVNP